VQYLLAKHLLVARQKCSSLRRKRVSPHVLRHYSAYRTMPSDVETGSRLGRNCCPTYRWERPSTRHSSVGSTDC
jgi:hypothetical protein